jgi:hypothetical protein
MAATKQLGRWRTSDPSHPIGAKPGAYIRSPVADAAPPARFDTAHTLTSICTGRPIRPRRHAATTRRRQEACPKFAGIRRPSRPTPGFGQYSS